jgi:hypothetical protein
MEVITHCFIVKDIAIGRLLGLPLLALFGMEEQKINE